MTDLLTDLLCYRLPALAVIYCEFRALAVWYVLPLLDAGHRTLLTVLR